MKKGSNAMITCTAPYAFGDKGLDGKVPGGASVVYEVTLDSRIIDHGSQTTDHALCPLCFLGV